MARRPGEAIAESAEAALAGALEEVVGSSIRLAARDDPAPGLVATLPDGRTLVFEVKAVAGRAEPGHIAKALRTWKAQLRTREGNGESYGVVVAAAIPDSTKEILRKGGWGWLDRRGELDVRLPGFIIHTTDVKPRPDDATRGSKQDPIRGRAGITVAACLLLEPELRRGVREIARLGEIAPSSASVALAELRDASLLDGNGRALVPDLFWALADAWKPHRESLAATPSPAEASRLGLGLKDLDSPGWVVGGGVAAAAWSAPAVVASDAPPDFYVPSEIDLRAARRELHVVVHAEQRACTIALAPSLLVVRPRHDPHAAATSWLEWPVVHPLFAALDLAQDRARGVEILDDWEPPSPFARVW